MIDPTSLNELLENKRLQTVFVGGKGGVGKTTCSSSIAIQFSKVRPKDKILLVSTDPAHNISDVFMQQFNGIPQNVNGVKNLDACEIDPAITINSDLETIKEAAVAGMSMEEEKTSEMTKFVDEFKGWVENVPGIDEAMALSSVLEHIESGEYSLLVFDTAPTGHTIRLLQLPTVLKVGIEKLKSWKFRLGGMFSSLASVIYQDSSAAAQQRAMKKLEEKMEMYYKKVCKISDIFRDNERTEFVCVCNASFLSVYETKRLISELKISRIACHNVIVNMLMMRAFSGVTPESENASAIYDALKHVNLDDSIARAVQDAVELCGGISRIQQKYLKDLTDTIGTDDKPIHLTFLPLLPAEVRGVDNLNIFSERLKSVDHQLSSSQNDISSHLFELKKLGKSGYVADTKAKFMTNSMAMENEMDSRIQDEEEEPEVIEFFEGDSVEIVGLKKAGMHNGKIGLVGKLNKNGRFEVKLSEGKRPLLIKSDNLRLRKRVDCNNGEKDSKTTIPPTMENITPEMMNLVQQVIMKPGGIKELLSHAKVKQMKEEGDSEMKEFFNDIETNGLFAGMKYMSNKSVMTKLAGIAKEIVQNG